MDKIILKKTQHISLAGLNGGAGINIKTSEKTVDDISNNDRMSLSLKKLTNIFQFNLYCKIEIDAMIKNYNFVVTEKIAKKLKFYRLVEQKKEDGTLSASKINSVIALADAFVLNAELQRLELIMLNATIDRIYGSNKFSVDSQVLKSFILDSLHDEESYYDTVFNLEENVRMAYVYIYKSRVARSKLV